MWYQKELELSKEVLKVPIAKSIGKLCVVRFEGRLCWPEIELGYLKNIFEAQLYGNAFKWGSYLLLTTLGFKDKFTTFGKVVIIKLLQFQVLQVA